MSDPEEVRRIAKEEAERVGKETSIHVSCLKDEFEVFKKNLYSEIKHRHDDSKSMIIKEEEARKAADDKHEAQTDAREKLLLYLISGAFSAMGLLATAMFYLVTDVQNKILLELCQQGQYLNLKTYSLFNRVATFINVENDSEILPILTEQILPNCHIVQ